MTKRLILIRHAKSSWDQPDKGDHERVLNGRGRSSALAVGQWMARKEYRPDLILCSDSARTAETCDLICNAFQTRPEVKFQSTLYHAAPDTILDLVKRQTVNAVAVIGHNPGIGMFANAMVAQPTEHPRFSDYPTCATTIMDFDFQAWSEVAPGMGVLQDFLVPRDL